MRRYHPPVRFGTVEEDVFRGGYPVLRNYEFLREKQVKTMIAIVPEIVKDLKRFCAFTGAELKHLKCEAYKGSDRVPSSDVVSKALELIVDRENLPAYVFCCDGGHVVGTICASLRRLQNWRLKSVLLEYKRFSKSKSAAEMVTQFMEMYSGPVKLKRELPRWLWNGVPCAQHPRIRCVQESSHSKGNGRKHIMDEYSRVADFNEVLTFNKNRSKGTDESGLEDAATSVLTKIPASISSSVMSVRPPPSPHLNRQGARTKSKFEAKTMKSGNENREYEALGIIL